MFIWYGFVLRREDGEKDIRSEGQRKKGKLKRTWKQQVEEESVKIGLRRCTLSTKVEC